MRKVGAEERYFSVALVMANHMEPGEERRGRQERALALLSSAVLADVGRRGACRDTDVAAATRIRAWG
jgi:hypothetical protein